MLAVIGLIKRMFLYGWAAPTSSLGLVCAGLLLVRGARARCVDGVLEVSGGALADRVTRLSGFSALTLGHVVLGQSEDCLHRLRTHEHVHVRQAERWGVLFIPIYLLAGLWQILRGRHAYYDNPFELEAFTAEQHMKAKY